MKIKSTMGWTIGVLGFDSRRGLGILLFATASRTALGPTSCSVKAQGQLYLYYYYYYYYYYFTIIITIISYHRFPFPWYFSSWTSGTPHHQFQVVELSLLHVMSLVQSFLYRICWMLPWYCFQIPLSFAYNSSGPSDYWYDEAFHMQHSRNFCTLFFFLIFFYLFITL
jgi:hypothetical protein